MKKDKTILARFTEEQFDQLKHLATNEGRSMAGQLRYLLEYYLEERSPVSSEQQELFRLKLSLRNLLKGIDPPVNLGEQGGFNIDETIERLNKLESNVDRLTRN